MKKVLIFFANMIPVVLMIWLITVIHDDYLLSLAYIFIIMTSLFIKRERKEVKLFFIGFFIIILYEFIFTNVKVETFERNSLFSLMPIWLPFLWGYCFIVIKRFIKIFNF
ncbi:MAG TPA: DUF2878 family protein [Candidatus Paceibacterota bacterium]|nr:DUF2878 family protein [Candidatus Paceibacterota bacterium]HPT18068.1 DUF2878 family protein [Candidatus Paceibacterota bacterium]